MTMETRVRLETITPEVAVKWLERNSSNRNIVQGRVDEIARDMKLDRFLVTAETIKFDTNGNLIDGQHRLWGCIVADVPFRTYVARGLDEGIKIVLDTGKKRTLGDWLQINGEKDSALLAGIVNIAMKYDRDGWSTNIYPTHTEATQWVEENPIARESTRYAGAGRRGIGCAPSPAGAAFLLNARIDADASAEFWMAAESGTGLRAGDPVLALRRWSVSSFSKREKPAQRTQFAYFLKAMDAWRIGKSMKLLHWRNEEGLPGVWSA